MRLYTPATDEPTEAPATLTRTGPGWNDGSDATYVTLPLAAPDPGSGQSSLGNPGPAGVVSSTSLQFWARLKYTGGGGAPPYPTLYAFGTGLITQPSGDPDVADTPPGWRLVPMEFVVPQADGVNNFDLSLIVGSYSLAPPLGRVRGWRPVNGRASRRHFVSSAAVTSSA